MDAKFRTLIAKVAKSLDNNETIPADLLAIKSAKALSLYPGDRTIGSFAVIMEKMAAQDKSVSRGAIKELYAKLYSNDTKFASVFAEELGEVREQESSVTLAPKTQLAPIETIARDQVLLNALKNAWEPGSGSAYSVKTAAKAKESVLSTLDSWNAKPVSMMVDAGNENFLVLRAEYETPKGKSSFYIPVDTSNDKICQASYFVANDGHHDINHSNIKAYLTKNAGLQVKFAATDVLHMLMTATSKKREVSNAELAVIRVNASKNAGYAFDGQIYGQTVDKAPVKDIQEWKSDEFSTVGAKFASANGQASFSFGDKSVNQARNVIVRELAGFGHSGSQVAVTKVAGSTVYFGVKLANQLAFTVPVKIENEKVAMPSMILCNGAVSKFDKKAIAALSLSGSDELVSASLSVHAGLGVNELLTTVKKSVAEMNYEKAEDALNVLANKDKTSYLIGLGYFTNGLSKVASVEVKEAVCDRQMMTKNSSYPICGHTGLPLHKTCKDKQGHCRPAYREGKAEGYDTAFYSTAKILG